MRKGEEREIRKMEEERIERKRESGRKGSALIWKA